MESWKVNIENAAEPKALEECCLCLEDAGFKIYPQPCQRENNGLISVWYSLTQKKEYANGMEVDHLNRRGLRTTARGGQHRRSRLQQPSYSAAVGLAALMLMSAAKQASPVSELGWGASQAWYTDWTYADSE
ncbi:hypothetical protein BKA70DRAFT_1237232 [Coprinopsis sp. MPI-PUGE-AT-0042]|nr:hypothetical protein BKA70DRAFT_1237232 [Coprinopsis sp. MPI-PUGE-AT-0042]